ncbi:YfiR family protein [Niveibacterium terrae]|uniref:YfiR family protein n=1 Tax=Niveibacterium terrae TaxID=3373598 RepID=UPI003A904F64
MRALLILIAATLATLDPLIASAAARDSQVKAAYLANFTRYIAWPHEVRHQICLVGADEIASWLEHGKSPLAVKRIADPAEVDSCSLLFLGRDSTQTRQWLAAARNKTILTVGEQEGFLQKGGIINLVLRNNTLRFEVSLENAQRARLVFSSRLLALAERVEAVAP